MARRESLHFDDVTVLILQLCGYLIERVLGLLAQRGLARAETNLGLRRGLVLIDVPDHCLDCGEAGPRGGCPPLGPLGPVCSILFIVFCYVLFLGTTTNAL